MSSAAKAVPTFSVTFCGVGEAAMACLPADKRQFPVVGGKGLPVGLFLKANGPVATSAESASPFADVQAQCLASAGLSGLVLLLLNTLKVTPTVKTSTPMKHASPMLYRFLDQLIARGLVMGLALWLCSAASFAAANAKPGTTAALPADVLQAAVKNWVAESAKVPADQVTLAPMDARMKVRSCEKALLIDLPFPNPVPPAPARLLSVADAARKTTLQGIQYANTTRNRFKPATHPLFQVRGSVRDVSVA